MTPRSLSRSAARRLAVLTATVLDNPYVGTTDWRGERHSIEPTPVQSRFLAFEGLEAFYGGAAGGGKSVALLIAALQYVEVPEYRALILRRNFTMLDQPGALMDLARQWLLGTGAVWQEKRKTWKFPSGAELRFGYLDNERDVEQYQGGAFHFIGYDELTQFTRYQYTYLFSRMRRRAVEEGAGAAIPLRMRATGNPGGIGHSWVKTRFIVKGSASRDATSGAKRVFIPAQLADNPHLDQASYVDALMETEPVIAAQLLKGDWDAKGDSEVFDTSKVRRVSRSQIPWADLTKIIRFWDLAATAPSAENPDPDWTAGVLQAHHRTTDETWVLDVRRTRGNPGHVDAFIIAAAHDDGVGVPIVLEEEGGSGGKHTVHHMQKLLPLFALDGQRPKGSKVVRAHPFASRMNTGKVVVVECAQLDEYLDELDTFPNGKKDWVDASSGGYNKLHSTGGTKSKNLAPSHVAARIVDGDLVLEGEHHIDQPPARRASGHTTRR